MAIQMIKTLFMQNSVHFRYVCTKTYTRPPFEDKPESVSKVNSDLGIIALGLKTANKGFHFISNQEIGLFYEWNQFFMSLVPRTPNDTACKSRLNQYLISLFDTCYCIKLLADMLVLGSKSVWNVLTVKWLHYEAWSSLQNFCEFQNRGYPQKKIHKTRFGKWGTLKFGSISESLFSCWPQHF